MHLVALGEPHIPINGARLTGHQKWQDGRLRTFASAVKVCHNFFNVSRLIQCFYAASWVVDLIASRNRCNVSCITASVHIVQFRTSLYRSMGVVQGIVGLASSMRGALIVSVRRGILRSWLLDEALVALGLRLWMEMCRSRC